MDNADAWTQQAAEALGIGRERVVRAALLFPFEDRMFVKYLDRDGDEVSVTLFRSPVTRRWSVVT